MDIVFVHGACVRDAAWWWHRMVEPLEAFGLRSVAVELPSCGAGGDLEADVSAVVEAVTGPSVLVGHSYGGVVITEAASRVDVSHLVYVAGTVPSAGDSLSSLAASGPPPPFLDFDFDGGTVGAVSSMFAELFMQDCAPELVSGGAERLTRQSLAAFGQPVTVGVSAPSTYVVCAEDRATPPAVQRAFAAKTDRVVEMAVGHHPFLSQPVELALVIAASAGIVGRQV
jgi:pimeloyl-ACP methyl ester carboxylesterase